MEKSLQPCLWNLNSPVAPSQLSCQISVVQCQAEVSANVRKKNIGKHVKTHTKGNDIITNVISANRQHSISTFSIFKFQRCSSKLSVLFPSCRQGALVPLLTGNILNRMSFWKWCLKHWWGEHWECLFFFFNAKWNAMNKGHEKWSNLEQGNYMISHPCRGPQMTLNFWESGYPCSRCQRVCLSTLPTNACLHENINVHFYCLANHDCIYQFLEDWPLLQKETKVNNLWILELLAACVSSLRFLS